MGVDSLEPQYPCPEGYRIFKSIQSRSNLIWRQHLDAAAAIHARLDEISGVPNSDSGFHVSFDKYFDNLSARQCHRKQLPCKLSNGVNGTLCVTQELANQVYRLGHWEYSWIYRDSPASLAASVSTFGVWVLELAQHLRSAMNGCSETVYYHNVAHDGSVSRLLSILQVDEMAWPGMGAEVVFELYQRTNVLEQQLTQAKQESQTQIPGSNFERYFIRVLYSGQVLKSSNPALGTMEMVPALTLLGYFDQVVGTSGSDVRLKCEDSGQYRSSVL